MIIAGIDPGIRGGIAVIHVADGGAPLLLEAADIPVVGAGARERVDGIALRGWIRKHKPEWAYIERAQAMPKQGSSSGFKYGRAVGAIETVFACCDVPVTIIEPAAWKAFHHLRGKDKEAGRQRAIEIFPHAHKWFARKLDHGRADAALIGLYGASPRRAGGQVLNEDAANMPSGLENIPKIVGRPPLG
jgi:crossover junction endodeoxyribonuclease RuvC